MLSDFDGVEVQPPLREPADPVEVSSAGEFQLTIPDATTDSSDGFGISEFGSPLTTSGRPSDAEPRAFGSATSGDQSDTSPQMTSRSSSSPSSRSVKFTGQIAPLK